MKITIWDIFQYIFKWKFVIIAVIIAAVIAVFAYIEVNQTYSSTAVLQMNDSSIANGTTPDGNKYDAYEITSPSVLSNVIKSLELNRTVNSLRKNFTVTGITPESETAIRESKEKNGEKYEYYPTSFTITYTGEKGKQFREVRDILEYTIDEYVDFYMQKYISKASINDVAYDDDMGNYDYIDMVELLNDNLKQTITNLETYQEANPDFRSTSTGYSFSDIAVEYSNILDYRITEVYSDIYRGQISKNKPRLLETYTQKKEKNLLEEKACADVANVAKTRMDSFSAANKNIPNAYNDNTSENDDDLAIIDGVDWRKLNPVTTYDDLMELYVKNTVLANDYKLDAERCDEIIAKFSAAPPSDIDIDTLTSTVKKNIDEIKIEVTELNKTAAKVMEDYNNVNAASHVSLLTGVNYYPNLSVMLFTLIAVLAATFFGVVLAITVEISNAIKNYNKASDTV